MVSIILPTYNSIQFLNERIETILNQNYKDWECVVIDGKSTDGTWAYLKALSKTDARFKLHQFAAQGVYHAWNKGVHLAQGDFIYFATSDDTMTPDCLEKLLLALEHHPECGLAHCCLSIINAASEPEPTLGWNHFPAQQFFMEHTPKYHIRKAPLCGMLYFTHQTIIHSFTQVLLKKSIFDRIGYFIEDQGPEADLEWGMRATLSESMVHVPLTLATWRVHGEQLTSLEVNREGLKRIIALQLMAVKNANINRNLKNQILTNATLLQTISIQQLLKYNNRFEKMKSKHYWKLKLLRWKYSEIKTLLPNRNDYFRFAFQKVTGQKANVFIANVTQT